MKTKKILVLLKIGALDYLHDDIFFTLIGYMYTFRGSNSAIFIFCLFSQKRTTLKGNNFSLHFGTNSVY